MHGSGDAPHHHPETPMAALSILDLSPILDGGSARQSLDNSLDIARHAERWGYRRYWLAEHHNMPGIASAATAVVIGHVAAGTRTIRVGSGGVMLPNHAPLVIAEQFGTLASLFPGRIDLGIGRAPGTDQRTAFALRRTLTGGVDDFPRDVVELQSYFKEAQANQAVRAIPGAGMEVPIWILGSSLYGAQLAAMLGLPYAFASHFAPDALMHAIELYRREFRSSEQLAAPYVIAGFNVFAGGRERERGTAASHLCAQVHAHASHRAPRPATAAGRELRGGAVGARAHDARRSRFLLGGG